MFCLGFCCLQEEGASKVPGGEYNSAPKASKLRLKTYLQGTAAGPWQEGGADMLQNLEKIPLPLHTCMMHLAQMSGAGREERFLFILQYDETSLPQEEFNFLLMLAIGCCPFPSLFTGCGDDEGEGVVPGTSSLS